MTHVSLVPLVTVSSSHRVGFASWGQDDERREGHVNRADCFGCTITTTNAPAQEQPFCFALELAASLLLLQWPGDRPAPWFFTLSYAATASWVAASWAPTSAVSGCAHDQQASPSCAPSASGVSASVASVALVSSTPQGEEYAYPVCVLHCRTSLCLRKKRLSPDVPKLRQDMTRCNRLHRPQQPLTRPRQASANPRHTGSYLPKRLPFPLPLTQGRQTAHQPAREAARPSRPRRRRGGRPRPAAAALRGSAPAIRRLR